MTTRLVTQEVTKSPTRLAAGLPIPLLLMPLQTDLRLLRGTGSATFTRSTIGTVVDKDDGLVKTAAIDAARFEQNGILIEGAGENLLIRAEEFNTSPWANAGSVSPIITANQAISPDGTMTADKIDISGSSDTRRFQTLPSVSAGTFTYSIYPKALPGQTGLYPIRLLTQGTGGSSADLLADLSDTEWKRFTIINSQTGSGDIVSYVGNRQVAGENIDVCFAWGAQLEELPFASSYMKTVASTVTRTADNLSIDAANIPAPTTDYTISMEVDAIGFDSGLSQVLFNVEGETSRRIAWNTTTGAIEATHGAVTSVSTSTFVAGDRVKVSFAVDATNQTLFINGIQEDQDAKGTVTGTATAINIGHQAGVNQAFSHIKPLRINNVALTAAQVGAL